MVYAHKVIRATTFGTFASGAEEWSTGFYLGTVDSDVGDPTQAATDALATYWQTFFTAANTHISSDWKCTGVKLALFSDNGHTVLDKVFTKFYTTALSGGEGGGSLPPQVTLVAQLATALPRGLGAKGRMYLPGIRTPITGSTGKIGSTEAGQIATTLKTFFNSVNSDADIPGVLVNASKGSGLLPALNARNVVVNAVRVGDVYDTQRRRRNALVETYATQALT